MQTGEFFQQDCHYLNIQEQTVTSYRLYSRFIYKQVYDRKRAINASKWGQPRTLARRMHVPKSLVNIP